MIVKDAFVMGNCIRNEIFRFMVENYVDFDAQIELEIAKGNYSEDDMLNKDVIMKDLIDRLWSNFNAGYDDILKVIPKEDPNTICIMFPYIDEPNTTKYMYDVSCIDKNDFYENYKQQSIVKTYDQIKDQPIYFTMCFMYEDREDILGYQMSPITIESYPIVDIVGALFWEVTWFGFTNEDAMENMTKDREKLDEVISDPGEEVNLNDLKINENVSLDVGVYNEAEKEISVINWNNEAKYLTKVWIRLSEEEDAYGVCQ